MFQHTSRMLPAILLMFATAVPAQDPPHPAADEELTAPLRAPGGEPPASGSPAPPDHTAPRSEQDASGTKPTAPDSTQAAPDNLPVPGDHPVPGRHEVPHSDAVPYSDALPQSLPGNDCPCRQQPAHAGAYAPGPYSMPAPASTFPPAYASPVMQPPVAPGWQTPAGGLHPRYPYYSYRRPWYDRGPASLNVTIPW